MKLFEITGQELINSTGISSIKSYLKASAKMQKIPEGFKTMPAKLLLDHGKAFSVDVNTYKGARDTPKECFRNAAKRAWSDDDLTYVEGYVSMRGVPLDHAWLVNKQGIVVDPTLKSDSSHAYFGIPIKTSYLIKHVVKHGYGVLSIMTNEDLYRKGSTDFMEKI